MAGNALPCLVSEELQDEEGNLLLDPEAEERIKWGSGVLFLGGSDTTVASIQMFLVAMLLFPSSLLRAQQEMDEVIGSDRLPRIEEKDQLPYCAAMAQEVLRWNPVVNLSLPHVLTEEEEYDGYVLPRGSIIVANIWFVPLRSVVFSIPIDHARAMTHDPAFYPDPNIFRPERFLTLEGKLRTVIEDGREVFGFGRRNCSGSHLAEASIFAFVCTFVWTANLRASS
ncbi:cytochrome P450 [Dacryopinax primogenitus]|uniref:Cytochrome P450 n=1 Tax=Dacryopinax primogenitus (strain DJM 731) TaxID=1858805 RepID=M5FQ28_DACPD|nr:cytochrome P450 [Dacryopinax primogenitus]EJT98940.1 cytochrome P450 [Dacryopinax primogenitus]